MWVAMGNTARCTFYEGEMMEKQSEFGYVTYVAPSNTGKRLIKALKQGILEGTRCTKCNTLYYPPRSNCTKNCLTSDHIIWEALSGHGSILSFSEVHIAPAGFERFAPYTVCVVNLREGGRLLAWAGEETGPLQIGELVKVIPEIVEGDRVVYKLLGGEAIEQPIESPKHLEMSESTIKKLKGRVSVITGAGSGIGRAIALEYAKEGATVVVVDMNTTAAENVVKEIQDIGGQAQAIPCDVSNSDNVQMLIELTLQAFQKIDILVNNAGISKSALIENTTDELWNNVLNVNLTGTFNCIRAITPYLQKKRPLGGKIINFTSTSAKFGNVGQIAYNASKAGVIAVTKTGARELARYKVNVNAIMPGFIETPMTAATPAVYKEQTIGQIPLMRTGTPEEIAKVVVFLGSTDSDYLTGSVIQADGGLRM